MRKKEKTKQTNSFDPEEFESESETEAQDISKNQRSASFTSLITDQDSNSTENNDDLKTIDEDNGEGWLLVFLYLK